MNLDHKVVICWESGNVSIRRGTGWKNYGNVRSDPSDPKGRRLIGDDKPAEYMARWLRRLNWGTYPVLNCPVHSPGTEYMEPAVYEWSKLGVTDWHRKVAAREIKP